MNAKRIISGRPWAIRQTDFEAIRITAENWTPKAQMDMPKMPEDMMMPDDEEMTMQNGVAVIDVEGVLVKSASWIDELLGDVCAVADLQDEFETALASDATAIVFNFDSGGGSVSGIPEFATRIYQARQSSNKPIIAVVDGGICCSGAYWLASSCDDIIVSEGASIGNVGVIATAYDFDRMIKNAGVDPRTWRSDDLKGAGGDNYQDAHGRAIQEQVAKYTSMFKDAVKRGRGLDVVDSRTLVGSDAVSAGYADAMGSLDDVLATYGKP